MKYILILALFCVSGQAFAGIKAKNEIQIDGEEHNICTLQYPLIKCWYANDDLAQSIDLGYAFKMAAGSNLICAAGDEGIKCKFKSCDEGFCAPFDVNRAFRNYHPDVDLDSITSMSLKNNRLCLAIGDSVECVVIQGPSKFMTESYVTLKNPRVVKVSTQNTCALDDNGIFCWNVYYTGYGFVTNPTPTKIGGLNNPQIFDSDSDSGGCAIDEGAIKCWHNSDGLIAKVAAGGMQFSNPNHLSILGERLCVDHDKGLDCFNFNVQYNFEDAVISANPVNAQKILNLAPGLCYLVENEVQCFQSQFGVKPLKVPNLNFEKVKAFPLFDLDQVSDYFSNLSKYSNPTRAKYFTLLQKLSELNLNPKRTISSERECKRSGGSCDARIARFLAVKFATPAILSGDSAFFVEQVIPKFHESFDASDRTFSSRPMPDTALKRRIALDFIQASFVGMADFLNGDDLTHLQEALRSLGQISDPMNNQSSLDLLKSVDSLSAEKQKLKSSPKSAFLVDSLELAANWLREKAK